MDVYDAIPTIVTTFVAIIAKISIFIFLLELVYYTNHYLFNFNWTYGLLVSSLLSLIVGTVLGLTQFRIKRLFAYSTISHVGFILLALTISSVESTQAFIFYLMQYSISNLNAFIILVTIGFSLVRRLAYTVSTSVEVWVADILSKSTSLPKAEMVEGPQHASKVLYRTRPIQSYETEQDRVSHDSAYCPSWANTHPGRGLITTALKFRESVKNYLKSVLGGQFLTKEIGCSSKRNYIDTVQRNVGSPARGNPNWWRSLNSSVNCRGPFSVGQRVHYEVGQRNYSTASSARLSNVSANTKLNLIKLDSNKFTGLYKTIADPGTLTLAYNNIKSKPGNMTPGLDNLTLDGMSNKLIKSIAELLQSGQFQFQPARRVHIPKASGSTRPLAVASPRDNIVQEAMRMVLEVIFEPTFSDLSHGFRPGRSCHSALKKISTWSGVTWAIEGDIKEFFNVNHHILEELLLQKIVDQRFIDLYWKLVKAGYVERNIAVNPKVGVPQGSLVSPLLSNIYLDGFDKFMEDIIRNKSTKKNVSISKINPEWKNLTYRISKLTGEYQETNNPATLEQLKELQLQRRSIASRIRTGNRLYYVRYADDWVVGIVGDRSFAIEMKALITEYLRRELKLTLSQENTKVTHLGKDRAEFLGVRFWVRKTSEAKVVKKYNAKTGKAHLSKNNQVRVWFAAPMNEILSNLEKQGFIKRYSHDPNRLIPNAISKFIFLDHKSILARYNAIISGYLNYYSLTDNYYKMSAIAIVGFIIRHSCAKTLARKFNLRTRAGAFKKFGKNLGVKMDKKGEIKSYELAIPKHFRNTHTFRISSKPFRDPFAVLNYKLQSQSNLD